MTSISKIQAALTAATNEVTVAAANLNFDFTLIKCEAPKEFHPLGTALSQKRKEDAEYGSTHVTARRLGALFEGMIPASPNLLRAYGSRVSEIAQASGRNSAPEPESSMFAAHAGIDGTSIWAAATSSPTALHVQLLACMLARVWPASEATSIWVELVEGRRNEIRERWNQNATLPYATLTAATQSQISRASLAEWDASARSWLRTADRAKVKHQDQLMILIANVNVPINQDMVVYQSVITAWKSAIDSIEKLTSGMPQASNHGPCLLALSSWHLYPDIILMGPTSVSHRFEDPLVRPGGTLTLGLARPGGDTLRGVFWSLSLAHLSFYGRRTVEREAELNIQSQKLSFQQFTIAVFGAFLARWGLFGLAAEAPARFIITLRNSIHNTAFVEPDSLPRGVRTFNITNDDRQVIDLLATAAAAFLDARKIGDDYVLKLVTLGGKKASRLLPDHTANSGEFGDPAYLLYLLKGPEERIALLRRILSDSIAETSDQRTYLIRFFGNDLCAPKRNWADGRLAGVATGHPRREPLPEGGFCHYPHVRWAPESFLRERALHHDMIYTMPHEASVHVGSMEHEFILENQHDGGSKFLQTYTYVYGDPGSAAIYASTSWGPAQERVALRSTTLEDLIWCLELDLVDMGVMLRFLGLACFRLEILTLKALIIAHQIYRALPTATVSTRALNYPLYNTRWARHSVPRVEKVDSEFIVLDRVSFANERPINQEDAFACVAWLEAGADINPRNLERVFALAYEDSIYVSMQVGENFGNP